MDPPTSELRNVLTITYIIAGTVALLGAYSIIHAAKYRTFNGWTRAESTNSSFIPTCKHL